MATIKKVKTIKEYQDCIDEVIRTKMSMRVKLELKNGEMDKAAKELKLQGVDVVVSMEFNYIRPL